MTYELWDGENFGFRDLLDSTETSTITVGPLSTPMGNSSSHSLPSAPDLAKNELEAVDQSDVIAYSHDTDTYRTSFSGDAESVWVAVISTVAVIAETKPTELPPLYTVIDPTTLKDLMEPSGPGPPRNDISVSFTYIDYTVTVRNYGVITVQPR